MKRPSIHCILGLLLTCLSKSYLQYSQCIPTGSDDNSCADADEVFLESRDNRIKISDSDAMLKVKIRSEQNALEYTLQHFKQRNDYKLNHFNRRPQADTVSLHELITIEDE